MTWQLPVSGRSRADGDSTIVRSRHAADSSVSAKSAAVGNESHSAVRRELYSRQRFKTSYRVVTPDSGVQSRCRRRGRARVDGPAGYRHCGVCATGSASFRHNAPPHAPTSAHPVYRRELITISSGCSGRDARRCVRFPVHTGLPRGTLEVLRARCRGAS